MAKLMLVEDDNNLREIYEARLQAEGYTIVSARDGEEALVVAKAEKPDLIISDVMMPKISGFEMLDILRNTDELRDVKVIMLTALGQTDDQQRAQKLGADRYLVKSQVTLEDIVKVAHDLLQDTPGAAASAASTPAPAPAVSEPPVTPTPPEPPAVAAPAATAAPETATAMPAAQSQAQEEAAIESKIENFVAGATEDPTPPATAAPAADDPAPGPAASSATAPDPAVAAVDDKLMDDAVKTLADSVDQPVEASAMPPEPAKENTAIKKPGHPGSVPIANKKVIQPIDTEPKKDIEELLALEEAKEKSTDTSAKPPVVGGEDGPQNASPDGPVDPHSIAL